jgi:hypothetical protein
MTRDEAERRRWDFLNSLQGKESLMWKKISGNRLEFYPYHSNYLFWFLGSVVSSIQVQNRPGIVALGVVTIPSVVLITIATVRTYRELP